MRAVEADLRPHRARRLRLGDLEPEALAQPGAQPRRGRDELEQRAERIDRHGRVGFGAMPASTVRLPLADFWTDNGDVVTAILSIVIALVVATLLDRSFAHRGRAFAETVTRGQVAPCSIRACASSAG